MESASYISDCNYDINHSNIILSRPVNALVGYYVQLKLDTNALLKVCSDHDDIVPLKG